jgi:UDPglucose 6-dehydrogenase
MHIAIVGDATLADATEFGCRRCRELIVTRKPDPKTEILWVCYDTPVIEAENFRPDVESVFRRISVDLTSTPTGALVLVSSQMPVGTTRYLEAAYSGGYDFAYQPENVRVATAKEDFISQSRMVVGTRNDRHHRTLRALLHNFTTSVIFTNPETAEMIKHALNCWLALNIAYINEIAAVCKIEGADPLEVSTAMKLDPRVGAKAPLRPGLPFGGGHLERELWNMNYLGRQHGLDLPLIYNIMRSNGVKAPELTIRGIPVSQIKSIS